MHVRVSSARVAQVALVFLVCAPLVAAPGAKTVQVDCDKGKSITQALSHPGDPLTVEISGFCQERVIVTRDNVTLIGADPTSDGFTGPVLDDPLVQRSMVSVSAARNVRFENLGFKLSEGRGLEVTGIALVEVVNARFTDNARGIQASEAATVIVEDSELSSTFSSLVTFSEGLIICELCTLASSGIPAIAIAGGRLQFADSTISTSGSFAVVASENGHIFSNATDASAGFVSLYADEGSHVRWRDGTLDGSVWAEGASQILLRDVAQTTNAATNYAGQDSFLEFNGGSFVGNTFLTGFSSGTVDAGTSFDTLSCGRGADLSCDGSETKTASSCGQCP